MKNDTLVGAQVDARYSLQGSFEHGGFNDNRVGAERGVTPLNGKKLERY